MEHHRAAVQPSEPVSQVMPGSTPSGASEDHQGASRVAAGSTPRKKAQLVRFDRVERTVHWVTALVFLVLVVTGAALFFPPLVALVGRRGLVEEVHVYAGLSLPIPLIVGVSGPWGRGMRRDLRRLDYWVRDDLDWLRALAASRFDRVALRQRLRTGKFNAGQKAFAAFVAGAGVVMLGSGIILRWFTPFPLSWREGATFVHNWLAVVLVVVLVGHVIKALSDRDALRSMIRGRISWPWIASHAPDWADELDEPSSAAHPLRPDGALSASDLDRVPLGLLVERDKPRDSCHEEQ